MTENNNLEQKNEDVDKKSQRKLARKRRKVIKPIAQCIFLYVQDIGTDRNMFLQELSNKVPDNLSMKRFGRYFTKQ